jgi:hypothetical protein
LDELSGTTAATPQEALDNGRDFPFQLGRASIMHVIVPRIRKLD